MQWTNWTHPTLPSFFNRERAIENTEVLREVLTARFLARPSHSHAISKMWNEVSPDGFLRLNALAEDLRLLKNKEGLGAVIRDLRSKERMESAWHTIHTAALFERANDGAVLCFLDAKNETAPDYVVSVDNQKIPVEAKLAMTSEVDESFQRSAKGIAKAIEGALSNRTESLNIVLVIRDALSSPDIPSILRQIVSVPAQEGEHRARLGDIRIYIEVRYTHPNFSEHRIVQIYAPVHEKDHLRLKGPAKHASKQLRALPEVGRSGILALGLSKQLEPENVFAVLGNEMRVGNYSGIAAALLIRTGTHIAHPRSSVIDLLEIRRNPTTPNPISIAIPLKPIDLCRKLTEVEPPSLGKPVYAYAFAQGKITKPGGFLSLPRVDRIANAMLIWD